MTLLFKLLSFFPLWLLHALGWVLGWVVFFLSSPYRRRFLANAALAGYPFAQVRTAVGHAGRMSAELPRLWFGALPPLRWEAQDCIERALQRGRGIVFLTPHLGCFEATGQAVVQRYGERMGPLTVLYRPARSARLSRLMQGARERPGLHFVPTNLAGVRLMIKALRQGHAVGLLPDQVPPQGLGRWVPFFGRDAYTMTLGARLAQQTGATVLLAWGERLSWGRGYTLHFREMGQPLAQQQDAAVLQINQEMEHLIRQCPQQYLWGYARYKAPRQSP
ncbi:MAG: lysophospholipid acyltransferase family protein [Betaproteobacteria bacterium]